MGRKLSFTGIAAGGGGGGGGGGGTGTFGQVYGKKVFIGNADDTNFQGNAYYSSMGRQLGGLKGNRFYFAWMQEYNSNGNYTRQRVQTFEVNRTTGAITDTGAGTVWQNSSGRAISTTAYSVIEGTGSCLSGGNNAYPGRTSHSFGHDYWQVYNGNITGGATYTQADHHDNGTHNSLCNNSDTSGRAYHVGYYQGNNPWGYSGRSHYRKWESQTAGNSPSVGGIQYPSNPHTSTCYHGHIYPQASNNSSQGNVHQGNSGLVSMCCMSTSSSSYTWYTMAGDSSETNQFTGSGQNGRPTGFQFQDGTVIWKKSNGSSQFYEQTSYNNPTAIDVTDYGGQSVTGRDTYSFCWGGLSGDYWISGYKNDYAVEWGIPMQIFKVTKGNKAQGGGSENKMTFTPPYEVYGYLSNTYQSLYPLWENSSDQYPKKMVYLSRRGHQGYVIVGDVPDSADWAT